MSSTQCPTCGQTYDTEQSAACPSCGPESEAADPAASPPIDRNTPGEAPRTVSALAVTALVLGLVSLCVPAAGLIPIVLGIVALVRLKKPESQHTGKGFAIAGIATGGAGLVMTCLLIVLMLPALSAARREAHTVQTLSHMRQVSIAMLTYTTDHDDTLPPHAGMLMQHGYMPSGDVFLSAHNDNKQPPRYQPGTPPPEQPYRFGDFVFIPQDESIDELARPGQAVLAYAVRFNDQQTERSVVFFDGHAARMTDAQLQQRLPSDFQVDAFDP